MRVDDISKLPPHIRAQLNTRSEPQKSFRTDVRAKGRSIIGAAQERMNKTERRFEQEVLKPGVKNGVYLDFKFEPFNLRLAKNTYYRPDFVAIRADDRALVVIEIKGHWEDDARVKWKATAELFPWFVFCAVQYDRKRGWTYEWYNR